MCFGIETSLTAGSTKKIAVVAAPPSEIARVFESQIVPRVGPLEKASCHLSPWYQREHEDNVESDTGERQMVMVVVMFVSIWMKDDKNYIHVRASIGGRT